MQAVPHVKSKPIIQRSHLKISFEKKYMCLLADVCKKKLQGRVANSTPRIFQWNLPEYSGLENMPKVANMENMILVL